MINMVLRINFVKMQRLTRFHKYVLASSGKVQSSMESSNDHINFVTRSGKCTVKVPQRSIMN